MHRSLKGIQRRYHGQPPDDLRDQAERFEVFWLDLPEQPTSPHFAVFREPAEWRALGTSGQMTRSLWGPASLAAQRPVSGPSFSSTTVTCRSIWSPTLRIASITERRSSTHCLLTSLFTKGDDTKPIISRY